MVLDHYTFGCIAINGSEYDANVIIFPDHVQKRWWHREGYRLAEEAFETVLALASKLA